MTPDSERKVSEQEFFFFVTEGDFEDAQNVRLQRQGLLHSAPQLPGNEDKSSASTSASRSQQDWVPQFQAENINHVTSFPQCIYSYAERRLPSRPSV
jgi:hypothetical protein